MFTRNISTDDFLIYTTPSQNDEFLLIFVRRLDITLFSEMDSRLRGNDIEVSFIRVIRPLFVSFVFQSLLLFGCGSAALWNLRSGFRYLII